MLGCKFNPEGLGLFLLCPKLPSRQTYPTATSARIMQRRLANLDNTTRWYGLRTRFDRAGVCRRRRPVRRRHVVGMIDGRRVRRWKIRFCIPFVPHLSPVCKAPYRHLQFRVAGQVKRLLKHVSLSVTHLKKRQTYAKGKEERKPTQHVSGNLLFAVRMDAEPNVAI